MFHSNWPAVVSGSFLKNGVEYAGSLTIDLPRFSIGAVGFYGSIPVGDALSDKDIVPGLRKGALHQKLRDELTKHKIKPAINNPIREAFGIGEWELVTDDDRRFVLAEVSGEVRILSQDKTLFIFGVLSAAARRRSQGRANRIHSHRARFWTQSPRRDSID